MVLTDLQLKQAGPREKDWKLADVLGVPFVRPIDRETAAQRVVLEQPADDRLRPRVLILKLAVLGQR